MNKEIAKIFKEMAELLNIKGDSAFHINAYLKASGYLDNLKTDVSEIYKAKGVEGLRVPRIVGEKTAKKIEEYIRSASSAKATAGQGKIKDFEDLKEETAIRQVITHYFLSKGLGLQELKENAKKRKIIYSRFTKPAKQLLELAGSVEKAKEAIDKVAGWANTRKLDYAIETVFKKWLELDRLKPKEIVKKPYYRDNPMVWSETKKKWYVIDETGFWLEFAG
ncbi:MAG: helix-hairpin-helix domain-containing protein, partial [Candidatus Pacebacteria bacterium]|nr:helix-hairpin-helix domain-containing protein [Candidatus Paceibacterota bacterium]